MANRSVRTVSLIAAYALTLHALFASFAPQAATTGNALLALSAICIGASAADQPAGNAPMTCAPDCAMSGCGAGGWTPAPANVIATMTPAMSPLQLQLSAQTLGYVLPKGSKSPRAPPLA